MEVDIEHDSRGSNPFIFLESPSSLQSLAATKLAFRLWFEKCSNFGSSQTTAKSWFQNEKFSCAEILSLPTSIRDIIDRQIEFVGQELYSWNIHYSSEVFFDSDFGGFVMSVSDVVCKSDGSIDCTATAMKLLAGDKLNLVEKYRVACSFCLEDEIRRIWPSVSSELRVNEGDFGKFALPFYWNCIMGCGIDDVTMESRIHGLERKGNWAAFEYFWNKLTEEEQISRVNSILRYADIKVIKYLLPKLNSAQALKVSELNAERILSVLLAHDEYVEYVPKFWAHMRLVIPGSQFFSVLHCLWKSVFNSVKSKYAMEHDPRNDLLMELWTDAPEKLRGFILKKHTNDFFDQLYGEMFGFLSCYDCDMRFLVDLLELSKYEVRNKIWNKNWRKLILRANPTSLEKLMNLCLANDEECRRFREHQMADFENMSYIFRMFLREGLFRELSDYLHFCLKDPVVLEQLSKRIVESSLDLLLVMNEDQLDKFDLFVCSTFTNFEAANEFKGRFFSSPESMKFLLSKLDGGSIVEIRTVVNHFLANDPKLIELKREFFDHNRRIMASGRLTNFDGEKLNEFLNWCVLDENAISEFRQSLPVDEIFENFLNERMGRFCVAGQGSIRVARKLPSFASLDDFLVWFFGDRKGARDYKTSKMYNYERSARVKAIFELADVEIIDQFLKWAFDRDTKEIDKFKIERKVGQKRNFNVPKTPRNVSSSEVRFG